jgi:zinc D-Ala-D-Ala carboxypeptidase
MTVPTVRAYEHWRDCPPAEWRWPSFSPEEIACRGTGRLVVDEDALDRLQALRRRLGKPLIILSGYRSPAHNARVGGEKNSQHILGRAFDVSVANHQPHAFEVAARATGFGGIGTYPGKGFIHIDTGPVRSWGEPFPADAPTFTPEPEPVPVASTNTAKATGAVAAAGIAGTVLSQAAPVLDTLGRISPVVAIALIVAVAAGVLVWRWRSPR